MVKINTAQVSKFPSLNDDVSFKLINIGNLGDRERAPPVIKTKPRDNPNEAKSVLLREQIEIRKLEGLNFNPPPPRFLSMDRGNSKEEDAQNKVTGKIQSISQQPFNQPSPLKKCPPSLLETEADKMWGKILNEDYRKFKHDEEMKKVNESKKRQEYNVYLKNQIIGQQKERDMENRKKFEDAERMQTLNKQKKLIEEFQRKKNSD